MNHTKLSLKEQNLDVDYLTFAIQNLKNNFDFQQIGNAFQKQFRYNYKIVYSETEDNIKDDYMDSVLKTIFIKPIKKPTWEGCIVIFPGATGKDFYNIIKKEGIPWRLFKAPKDRISLTRLDIAFTQPWNSKISSDIDKVEEYMTEQTPRHRVCTFIKNRRGRVLTMGSRKATHFFRIYSHHKGLRFELEIKKFSKQTNITKLITQHFNTTNFTELEDILVKHYIKKFANRLDLSKIQHYWLLDKIRKIFPNQNIRSTHSFVSTYMGQSQIEYNFEDAFQMMLKRNRSSADNQNQTWNFHNEEAFLTFLKLCAFLAKQWKQNNSVAYRNNSIFEDGWSPLEPEVEYIDLKFRFTDMLEFFGIQKINNYQRKKFRTFIKVLPYATQVTQEFDDETFASIVIFPVAIVCKANDDDEDKYRWIVKIKVEKAFLEYSYPFQHSDFFIFTRDKYDCAVKLMFIRIFNQPSPRKEIPVKRFLQKYKNSGGIVNQRVKFYLLEAFQELRDKHYIQPYYIIKSRRSQSNEEIRVTKLEIQTLYHANYITVLENYTFINL